MMLKTRFLNPTRLLYSSAKLSHQTEVSVRYQSEKRNRIFDDFDLSHKNNHIPISLLQRSLLTLGSATVSILDPTRADMIACLGETVGEPALKYILRNMESSTEGKQILRERPRINSNTIDLHKLKELPEGTLGKMYSNFLEINNVTPDSRTHVQFVDDVNLAYVMQRYREVHDLFHTLLQMPTNMLGEVTVKWVEAIQTRLPMCIGGALVGPIRLRPKHRQKYIQYHLPWAIKTGNTCSYLMNIYFEKRWEQNISDLYKEFNIQPLIVPK